MFQCGYLVLLVVICFSCMSEEVGALRQKRLIKGEKFNKGEFPHLVSLWFTKTTPLKQYSNKVHHYCVGALIHESWVLTAGHCFEENVYKGLSKKNNWRVYLGMHNQTEAKDAQERFVHSYYFPTNYNFTLLSGDIALVKLNQSANLNANVQPIQWNNNTRYPNTDDSVTVLGWGQVEYVGNATGPTTNEPHKLNLQVVSQTTCETAYSSKVVGDEFGEITPSIDDKVICAGEDEKSICGGDAGAPAISKFDGQDVVVGVAIFAYKCAQPGYPSVFTKVSSFQTWISDTISTNS